MRADLDVQDVVSLPRSMVTTTQGAMTGLTGNPANNTAFTGNYIILSVHHYGSFTQQDSASWASVFELTPEPKPLAA